MSRMNDKELEKLLKALPKVEDHRNPQEIYQNVTLKMKKQKQRPWLLPSLASFAALLLFMFSVPYLMEWEDLAGNSSKDNITTESSDKMRMMEEQNQKESQSISDEQEQSESNDISIQKDSVNSEIYSAVYAQDRAGARLFTYPIPDRNGQVIVPITVLAPIDQTKPKFEQFEELMPFLKEEALGLSDYYPLNADLTLLEDKKTLHINLPTDHTYEKGSSAEKNFLKVVNDVAAMQGIETISFATDGKPGVSFAHTGYLETVSINKQKNHGYYFYNIFGAEKKPYLVPSPTSYGDIEEALQAMKENIEINDLQASIPDNFNMADVVEAENVLIIHLDDSTSLADNDSILYTIEAILLTAKSFNFDKVRIENANLKQIGKFVFSEEWKVPEAPNRVMITE